MADLTCCPFDVSVVEILNSRGLNIRVASRFVYPDEVGAGLDRNQGTVPMALAGRVQNL